jgi:microcystin-dependent protein
MAIPTIEWDESNPSGQQEKSLGAQRISELKTQFREMFAVDHVMLSTGSGTTWGYHNKATLQALLADPTASANTGCLYSKDVTWNGVTKTELHWIDSNGNVIQITSQGDVICGIPKEIRIWSGTLATIPRGWALCDGTNSTPNLTAKFIRGINTSATNPGTTGGADSLTLLEANLPSHTHATWDLFTVSHSHNLYATGSFAGSDHVIAIRNTFTTVGGGATISSGEHSHGTAMTGVYDVAYDNRPAYVEEAFIMKTA